MKSKKGFTLIEILVVIAIIGIIGTLSAVAVNSARSKQRDATRLANIRQLMTAFEDYYNENNQYPTGELLPVGDPTTSACLGITGFHADCSSETATLLRFAPTTFEDGLKDVVTCGEPKRNAFCFTQRAQGSSYVIHFELENALTSVGLQKGVNCATPEGMQAGVCPE